MCSTSISLEELAHVRVVVDHDERHARALQVLGDLAADPAEAADEVMVLELGDLALHAAFVENSREVARDEQLRQRDEKEEHRTHAEDRQEDLGDLAAQGRRIRGAVPIVLTVSSDRVTAPPVGHVLEPGHRHRPAEHENGDGGHEQGDPAQEEGHLVACGGRPGRGRRPTRCSNRSTMRVPDCIPLLVTAGQ